MTSSTSSPWLRVASQGRRSLADAVSVASAAAGGESTPRWARPTQTRWGAEDSGQPLGQSHSPASDPADPMMQDRLQRAAVVEFDRGVQAPFVLVGPVDGRHVLGSSAEDSGSGLASQVGDGERSRVGHRVTAMPIREDRGPGPPDGRAGPAA